jgi:hypothetical protein
MRGWTVLLVALMGVGIGAAAQGADEARLEVGAALLPITPPVGMPMAGYYSKRLATGVHDDLYAHALFVTDGKTEAAWVVCDIISVDGKTVAGARKRIESRTGIPADHVMVSATHTHTGPLYHGTMPGLTEQEKETVGPMQKAFVERLTQTIADAVVKARESKRPARLEAGVGEEKGLSFNRRFHMKDGSVKTNPGRGNREVVRAAGPIDPRVAVLAFRAEGSTCPMATVVNFALHCDTIGGTEISACYPSFLYRRMWNEFGKEHVPFFAQGCCGDINHIDVSTTRSLKGFAEGERIGSRLAGDVIEILKQAKAAGGAPVAVSLARVTLPIQKYSAEEVAAAKKAIETKQQFLDEVKAHKIISAASIAKDSIDTDVQVIRIGDVAIVGLPGEIFVELGFHVREHSPFKTTIVTELANDAIKYVPTKKAFGEGSYEVTNSIVTPGGGEALAEKAVELLKGL